MILDALFGEFPAEILKKLTVSGRKIPEIRCKGPVAGFVHWHAGSLADFSIWADKLE